MDDAFVIEVAPGRMMSTAVHAGHELRAGLVDVVALDPSTRLREEDPFTDLMLGDVGIHVVVNRSRFEVDLNRSRDQAVYRRPNEAFGPNVWKREVQPDEIEESRRIHDDFYAALSTHLDRLAADGRFLVLDVHSYNHRRRGRSRALPTGYACLTVAAASAHDRHALPAGDGAIHLFRRRFGAGRTERLARAGSCSGGLADKWL